MWRTDRDRLDDPRTRERETRRLARDEYDRPRYGSAPTNFAQAPAAAAQPFVEQPPLDRVRVHEFMTRRVSSVHPGTSVERAARLMAECDCGALPVTDGNGYLIGMITDRDIALRLVARGRDARRAVVADCMTERVFACFADESVADLMREMAHRQVRRMPIVDREGRLVGIVAQGDLARHAGAHPLPHERRFLAETVCALSQPPHLRTR